MVSNILTFQILVCIGPDSLKKTMKKHKFQGGIKVNWSYDES